MSKWRRYEVLFPRQFNDGRPVPSDWIDEAVQEITDHFGAVSFEKRAVQGHWRQGGVLYRDEHGRLVVDVPDKAVNRRWMLNFKSRWRQRLKQLELWLVSYRIEVE